MLLQLSVFDQQTFFEVLIISHCFHFVPLLLICVYCAYVPVKARTGPMGLANRMFANTAD